MGNSFKVSSEVKKSLTFWSGPRAHFPAGMPPRRRIQAKTTPQQGKLYTAVLIEANRRSAYPEDEHISAEGTGAQAHTHTHTHIHTHTHTHTQTHTHTHR